jgi:hypothetical protein
MIFSKQTKWQKGILTKSDKCEMKLALEKLDEN